MNLYVNVNKQMWTNSAKYNNNKTKKVYILMNLISAKIDLSRMDSEFE